MELVKVKLPFKVKKAILALGSQTKNSLGFATGSNAILSPMLGDLDRPSDFQKFKQQARRFLKNKPRIIACDLHPDYRSSRHASGLASEDRRLIKIQHHHAHIASCMVDNGLKNQKVIGVAFDGTGLGTDNTLWGAEFLIADYRGFKRAAHLKPVRLLGSEAAIREPWRLALAWLFLAYGESLWDLDISLVSKLEKKQWSGLKKMQLSGFNSPLTSSMGRLFDAAGALILAQKEAHFEAELAIGLEKLAGQYNNKARPYPFKIIKTVNSYIVDPLAIFKAIISDLEERKSKAKIAYCFHLTVAELTRKIALALRKDSGLNKIALSGGVFQNHVLCRMIDEALSLAGFKIYRHQNIPAYDSGIALGQIAVANNQE